MSELLSALLIGAIVTFVLFYNIKKITQKLEKEEEKSFDIYSSFAIKVEEYLREIKKKAENKEFVLKNKNSDKEFNEKLLKCIRELLFFETIEAKKLKKKEAEERLFEILSFVDEILIKYLQNGEEIADDLREKLYKEYEKIKNDI